MDIQRRQHRTNELSQATNRQGSVQNCCSFASVRLSLKFGKIDENVFATHVLIAIGGKLKRDSKKTLGLRCPERASNHSLTRDELAYRQRRFCSIKYQSVRGYGNYDLANLGYKTGSSKIFDRPKRTESFSEFIYIIRDEKNYLTVIATISLHTSACQYIILSIAKQMVITLNAQSSKCTKFILNKLLVG
jgi:hypothetical protein